MPKPNKLPPMKRRLPAYIMTIYAIIAIAIRFFSPELFSNLGWWVYFPLLPLEIWFIIAYRQDNQ
jgi:Na+-translocating ferredoxin:NAD+ oxidoreductase RnfE subunit